MKIEFQKIKTKLLKSLLTAATAFILCALQCCVGMNKYDGLSANCMECFLITEVVAYSLIVIFLFPIAYFVFAASKITSRIALFLLITGYAACCVFVNHSLFVSRESAWSTYTFSEEMSYVFSETTWTILLSAAIFCYLVWRIKNKNSQMNKQ